MLNIILIILSYSELHFSSTLIELLNRMRNHEFRVYQFMKVINELNKILESEQQLKDSLTRYKSLSRLRSDIQP